MEQIIFASVGAAIAILVLTWLLKQVTGTINLITFMPTAFIVCVVGTIVKEWAELE